MPLYTPPLRDMQFVLHEVFDVASEFKAMPAHAETDADTVNAVLEEAGKEIGRASCRERVFGRV